MRKADLVSKISEETNVAKVDVLVALENLFTEIKDALAKGENVYIRGSGSFVLKKRAKKLVVTLKKTDLLKFLNIIFLLLNHPKYSLIW